MDQIRRLRHKHGLTLKQLAHECGIEWKALSAYERYQRQWPDEIRRRALKVMGEEAEEKLVTLSRAEVRQLKGPLARRLVSCDGPNWENQPPAYEDVYRWIPKESLPDPTFRRLVRCDSSLEALAWSQLAAAGARAVLSNPIDLGFDRYPLITSQGESPINLWLPALHLAEHWLVFPQLTLAANWRPVRPDGLLLDWLAVYLQDRSLEIAGRKIWGSPWQPEFGNWAFNLPRGPSLARIWSEIPADTEILITHTPPLGYLDRGLGCEELRARLEHLPKLRLHVFGHIHSGYGIHRQGQTVFVNGSICDDDYAPINAPLVLDL